MNELIEQDPAWERDLHQYLVNPERMPIEVFSELHSFAANPLQLKRLHVELKQPTQEELDKARRDFVDYLKGRESQYSVITPEPGMISVTKALSIAHDRFSEYDEAQEPKIELDNNVYNVTLWQYRKPHLPRTESAAVVHIDAWSGEVISVRISAD